MLTMRPAVAKEIEGSSLKDKIGALKTYNEAAKGKSNNEARAIAADILNKPVAWDWDGKFVATRLFLGTNWSPLAPRTREGYYHYTGGIEVSPSPSRIVPWCLMQKAGCYQAKPGICALC